MKLSTQIIVAFALVIVTSIMDSVTNYTLSIKVRRNTEFLAHSESVIRNSNRLHKTIIEMQSAFRGFLLTEDTTFLDLYQDGLDSAPALFTELRGLIANNTAENTILDSITALHQEWLGYSSSLIAAKLEQVYPGPSSNSYSHLFETQLKKQVGKKLNDEITEQFQALDRNEYKLRSIRSNRLMSSIDRTHGFSFLFLGLTTVIGIVSAIYIVLLISRRIKMMVHLAENITKGEFTAVQDNRNDELTGLSRSLNIMSDRLSKTINELKYRNTELNKFAYVVSHDLKAPVRGIYNVVQWIEEDMGHELSPELRKYLDIIPQRTRRMEDLINGLLDYARINEQTHVEKIDTGELVHEIAETVVPRNFKVEIYDMPVLYSERLKLEQVFTNLISNAVKYTTNPEGRLLISCTEMKDYYRFSVKDNGIGIDPEYHEKIFEIFQTLREKHEKESTGIGLAIVKRIIDGQHGNIQVISKAGAGAEFVFTWPKQKVNT